MIVPVEDPRGCEQATAQVNQLASFVSNDDWNFEFVRLRHPKTTLIGRQIAPNSSVSLFSGGLDSLCGAAAALRRGDCPVFVTHGPPANSRVESIITRLSKELNYSGPSPRVVGFRFQSSALGTDGKRSLFPERSRRTRPVLYLCLAGAVALECEIPTIYLNENGVLAINLPLGPNFHGSLISRHAHPETLRRFESVLLKFWEGNEAPKVLNPFSEQTKGEQLSILGPASPMAAETISCEYAGQQVARIIGWLKENGHAYQDVRECGLCLPCLVRRTAMEFAGVPDKRGHYAFGARRALRTPGVYKAFPLFSFLQDSPRDLLDFAQVHSKLTPSEFVVKYASQLALLHPPEDLNTRAIYDLYQRFARQTKDFLVKG